MLFPLVDSMSEHGQASVADQSASEAISGFLVLGCKNATSQTQGRPVKSSMLHVPDQLE